MEIDGRWCGFYTHSEEAPLGGTQTNEQFGITAILTCVKGSLTGRMTDERTLEIIPYSELLELDRDSMGTAELARAEALLAANPNLGFHSYLPPNSLLRGTFDGRKVRFLK